MSAIPPGGGATDADAYAPCAGRVVPPRAHLSSDAPRLDLCGEWDFELVVGQSRRSGRMPVPSHWVLAGDGEWGRPAYTNVQYPFPVDPPYVPDVDPTGTYRREFSLPDAWLQPSGRVLLRLLGAESEARVVVNDVPIGMTRGSRLTREFDLTGVVRAGTNSIEITVRQWSPGSYLEDQDQWWLPGLFRDVELLLRPDGGIDDVWLGADYDPVSGQGRLRVEVVAPGASVRVGIPELAVDETLEPGAEAVTLDVGTVEPWSAESPRLYDATVATASETVSLRVGFRRTEIVDGTWLVNGRRLTWSGVNRHEVHRTRGRVFDEDWVRADLALMKAFNVNGIRTSHYPPHPRVLDLCDELGLYVMLENDYESHGFLLDDWSGSPSSDPRWREALLDRMQRTVERDKNHACVIAYSLGNEAYTGENLAAMADWTRMRDRSRPIHYEGDHEAAYTDVYSRMYPSVAEVSMVLEGSGPVAASGPAARVSVEDAARIRTRPYFLCEYLHAMGTGPGGISGYVDAMRHPRHAGGCVWEWRDHALDRVLPDGSIGLAYGGDFGEAVHDGTFVCDGLVSADSEPSAGLFAWANAVAPVVARPEASGEIVVTSDLRQATASGLVVAWSAGVGGDAYGEVALADLAPGESVVVRPDADPGEALTAWVLDPVVPGIAPRTPRAIARDGTLLPPAVGETDELGRRVVSVRQYVGEASSVSVTEPVGEAPGSDSDALAMVRALRPTLFRAPTDNDRGGRPSDASVWSAARLGLLEHRLADDGEDHRVWVSGVPSRQRRLTTSLDWSAGGVGLVVTASFEFSGDWPNLPRIGLTVPLPAAAWDGARVTWTGLGPCENYPDMAEGVWLGTFTAGIDELWGPHIRPQESGHRKTRELLLNGAGGRLRIRTGGSGLGFSLCRWTPQQLDAAAHVEELPPSDVWWLTLDAAHAGIGTASCGPGTDPRYAVRPETTRLVFEIG
ncbi:MAG: glycoside hydrolase family 2 TIM barrel-domain containing protein [Propionibacteriaceae bacterium]